MNALKNVGINLNGQESLSNHLSVELIPWHTKGTNTIQNYISSNLQSIHDNCLQFAALESNRITNSKLKSKVILRMSGSATIKLLNSFQSQNICNHQVIHSITKPSVAQSGIFKFSLNTIPTVEFISIWGMRNDFPSDQDMKTIFLRYI